MEEVHRGRPREFDTDAALDKAMTTFWAKGYEGASLADLTGAMGISRKSMYAAFGNKEQLFRVALDRYSAGPGSYVTEAMKAPTSREVARLFLTGSLQANTTPGLPTGCLGVQGALTTGESGIVARDILAEWRAGGQEQLRVRFQRAIEDGDLPESADAELIARYVMTIANGMAVQAAGGAAREDLQRVADAALRSWPPA
ncbi:MAG: TetR/AcrR family transcriptional regulator [Humibacter sp.]